MDNILPELAILLAVIFTAGTIARAYLAIRGRSNERDVEQQRELTERQIATMREAGTQKKQQIESANRRIDELNRTVRLLEQENLRRHRIDHRSSDDE